MARICCTNCNRPEKSCICRFTSPVENIPLVVVLQHVSEVKQSKGTVALLSQSLSRCIVLTGEDFSENIELNRILEQYRNQVLLVYPSEQAESIPSLKKNGDSASYGCVILLDGTWKKAYKMYMLAKNLHNITHIRLPENIEGQYKIRKTMKKNALSTLEACCYALGLLEQSPEKYQALLNEFIKFNEFQLSFKPTN